MPEAQALAIGRDVSPRNFARSFVVAHFLEAVSSIASVRRPEGVMRVAVVGGSSAEPELLALTALGIPYALTVIGLDHADYEIDLNVRPESSEIEGLSFDLVVSSQVLEHVWNHESYFDWLSHIARPSAHMWIGATAANRPHASPDYFSAGFTDSYLRKNLEERGTQIIDSGMIGSQRLYNAALTEDIWLSVDEHNHPVIGTGRTVRSGPEAVRFLMQLPKMTRLARANPHVSGDERFAVESWVWAQALPSV
jgi:hypothetical protein